MAKNTLHKNYNRDIQSALIGLAIGDAYGAGIEFQSRDWIRANVDFTKFVNARHSILADGVEPALFTQHYKAWDYTDDTEMTLGLYHALHSGRPVTEDLLVEYWILEYEKGIQKKGYGRNGHGSMRWVFEGKMSMEAVRNFQRARPFPGNAPVMRVIPIGFLPEEQIDAIATINADATHPHPVARAASVAIARAARYFLVEHGNAEKLISYCLSHIEGIDASTSKYLKKVDALPSPLHIKPQHYKILLGPQPIEHPRFPVGIMGLPSDAMLTAGAILWVLKHSKTPFEGLKTAIYLGGDVDSVAGVCTGILAGLHGLESLPDYMIQSVETPFT